MFLKKTMERNPVLIDAAFTLHQGGVLLPDTYVLDLDVFRENARLMLEKATENKIRLFFMLKQLGRNPLLAKELLRIGYPGAVAVDFREALTYIEHEIPLCNVGHLVQVPKALVQRVVAARPEIITVFTPEKLQEIDQAAAALGVVQDVMLKVAGPDDLFYSGQYSGIELSDLDAFVDQTMAFAHVRINGLTVFPCYLYDAEAKEIRATPNAETLEKGAEILRRRGIIVEQLNAPSTTSILTIERMKEEIGNTGEPGHGLTATTPAHADMDLPERPAVVYLSEVSHTFRGKSYCYGGGHYRRSHVKEALVQDQNGRHIVGVEAPDVDSIDYYFGLTGREEISAPVLMAFRYQIFVSRSRLALVEGVQTGHPRIVGIYDALGREIDKR